MNEALRERVGLTQGRCSTPSAVAIDSQLLVDTEGLLLKVKVDEAGMSDSAGAKMVVEGLSGRFPRMRKVWADYAADLRSG